MKLRLFLAFVLLPIGLGWGTLWNGQVYSNSLGFIACCLIGACLCVWHLCSWRRLETWHRGAALCLLLIDLCFASNDAARLPDAHKRQEEYRKAKELLSSQSQLVAPRQTGGS
jgi:hypothetical protein